MYEREQHLVEDFIDYLNNYSFDGWENLKIATEFDYRRGRTDVIALTESNEIIAFEAKLTKWKNALDQAYRNTCFAHYSYIILPKDAAYRAMRYPIEFAKRSVGVCYISGDGNVVITIPASHNVPIQEWLSQEAKFTISQGCDL